MKHLFIKDIPEDLAIKINVKIKIVTILFFI